MTFKQMKTDSSASNSAKPKDCGLLGSVTERFQLRSGPQILSKRSKSWLEAYLGILLTKMVFLRDCYISTGMRVEINKSEANDFWDLTTG